ncbi:uncharacterized protein LOC129601365 isoform X1 [Paramacrobiotus metropolitanus]|uniref:uncharacterized protein LOC129601365 isoform X1 n=1 Tax=Paramacrobiotus metropolitanus TaxID=2943436 RepID=UPI002445EA29|nr:uncharacterized protein LOC129601365 isoform X1 [Paramacrobiotus metropolitanus]
MERKPNILRQMRRDTDIPPEPIPPRYTSDTDTLFLEDESQRIRLNGQLDPHQLVTGIIMALVGHVNAAGVFVVQDQCFPTLQSRNVISKWRLSSAFLLQPAFVLIRDRQVVHAVGVPEGGDIGSDMSQALGAPLKLYAEKKHLGKDSYDPEPDENQLLLFSMRFCPYAERARLMLNLKKVQYELVNMNTTDLPKWYADYSPLGDVPALRVPGKVGLLFDSVIIPEYIDQNFPTEPKLLPKDEYEKAPEGHPERYYAKGYQQFGGCCCEKRKNRRAQKGPERGGRINDRAVFLR